MKKLLTGLGGVVLLGLAVGCGGGGGPARPPAAVRKIAPAARPTQPPARPTPGGPVQVSARGSWFDPPIAVERLPDRVWFCDKGMVHFASQIQGKGTCPRCGMKLRQKVGAAAGPPTTSGNPGL